MEEDIKILEELLNANVSFKISPEDRGYKALENLIKKYRELEEENRIFALAGSNIALKLHIEKNYIPKSKIKEKIEELKEEYKIALEENSTKAFILKCQIEILEKLLEDK